ncbi:MAG: dihydroneopterin aldolase [Muribaculaceae bacterium]|nr:dihydroneopterin aldolase [Muribaculaceae bacterium]
MDRVELNRVRIYAHHGVMEQERKVGNLFEVTVHLEGDMQTVMQTDDISAGISYADIFEEVRRVMDEPSKTLEHVAYRLKSALLLRFPQTTGGRITVSKLTPPFAARLDNASFTHTW